MPSNIALMKEKRRRLLSEQGQLQAEAKGLARDIPVLINPTLSEIEDMEIAKAAAMMDSLVVKQAELMSIKAKLWELEEEIGL